MAGHDADLAFAGRDHARAVWADQSRCRFRLQIGPHADHIVHRDALRDAHHQRQTSISGFHNGIGCKRRRDKNYRRVGARGSDAFAHGVKDRTIQMLLPAFAGRRSAHHFCSVVDRLLGVESTFAPGETLKQNLGVFVNEYTHCASLTTFSAASAIPSATVKLNPDSVRILRPRSTFVPSMRITTGMRMLNSCAAETTPLASVSQRKIPPKM